MSTLHAPASTLPRTSPVPATFEPARVRCLAEDRVWSAIQKKTDFHERLTKAAGDRDEAVAAHQVQLLMDTYRVDAAISPRLHALRERLRSALKLMQPLDLYVLSDPSPNAFCPPTRKSHARLSMALHSSLFNLLSEDELLFVMGHEVGHALLDHTAIPQINFDHPDFSPLEVVRLRSLQRTREISCDRIGLLACQDVRAASSALFKLMSGLTDQWLAFNPDAFVKHFDDISVIPQLMEMGNSTATHPVMAIRIKALLAFAQSEPYAAAIGKSTGSISQADLERATEGILAVLEPDLTDLENASEDEAATRFLTRGALAIVAADGTVEPAEIRFLASKGLKLSDEAKAGLAAPDAVKGHLAALQPDANVLARKLSVASRVGLIREMCFVALSAGGVSEIENDVIIALAQMLDISPDMYRVAVESAMSAIPPAPPAEAKPKRKARSKKKTAKTRSKDPSASEAPEEQSSAPPPAPRHEAADD